MAANRSHSRRRPRSKDPIKEARAQKSIWSLREHWKRGAKANAERDDYTPRELSVRLQVNYHTLRKERAFARKYGAKDLDELTALRRPNGTPLHWGHVMYLITVPTKRERRKLQKKAAAEGWSSPELCRVIQKKFPKRIVSGGRPQKIPTNPAKRVRLMIDETDRWLRRCNAVLAAESAARPRRARRARSAEVRALNSKLREMVKLAEVAKRRLT